MKLILDIQLDGRDTYVKRISFRSKRQLPMIMVIDEHYRDGNIQYASVAFNTMNYNPFYRLRWWLAKRRRT